MSNKEKPSKKAVREKKKAIVEDLTFGLKNKNKSKKVQQFIERTEKSIKSSNGGSEAAKSKEAKKEAKLIKQLQEEELRVLFNEGIAGQFGKKKSKAQNAASQLGIAEANKTVSEFLEALSSESSDNEEDENDRHQTSVIYIPDEPVVTEVFREKTIEDIIEEQRAKLAAEGKVGTPVTAESFARWRAGKLAQKQAAAEARVKAEQSKKKGGRGLSVLSGKELFNYNSSLFVDDDAALDAAEESKMSVETRQQAVEEERRIQEETERAQIEQQRLAELQQIELEVRRQKEEERRKRARDSNRVTFILLNVVINQAVFEEDEKEDLAPFPEEILSEMTEVKKQEDFEGKGDWQGDRDGEAGEEDDLGNQGDDDEDEDDDDEEEDEEEEDEDDDDDEENEDNELIEKEIVEEVGKVSVS